MTARPSFDASVFETDHELAPRLDIVRTVAVVGSALIHLAAASVAVPFLSEPAPRLSANALELTVELPLPPPEEAAAAAPAVRAPTAAEPDVAPDMAPDMAPDELAIVLPSAAPPPVIAAHDFAAGPEPAARQDPPHALLSAADGAAIAGEDISRVAPASSGSAPARREQMTVAAQGTVREDRPRHTVQKNQRTEKAAVAPAASRPAPERAAALEQRVHQARQDYLARLVAQLSRQRFDDASGAGESGVVVTRLDIARDGQLLDVGVVQSSGRPAFDRSVEAAIRRSAPFAPLPPDLAENRFSFVVPIGYALER
ncbi:MAG: TonB family protein [Alphaproteobacteria bacterium]|nr:TonB family protein [Alphaproteobacteria bacterium]